MAAEQVSPIRAPGWRRPAACFALLLSSACGAGTLKSPAMGTEGGVEPVDGAPRDGAVAGADGSVLPDGSLVGPRDGAIARDADLPTGEVVLGGPGCGFDAAAFCDTFDGPAAVRGRAGELDARHWSAGRLAPQLPSGNGVAIGIGPAAIPSTCRADLPSSVSPDQDALICASNDDIQSPHLMVVTAAQNYGQNSYRIRQPFDFTGRTGVIKFDADATVSPLLGWISVEITEDPVNAPSFAAGGPGVNNDEGSLIPRRAVEVQLQNPCGGSAEPAAGVRMVAVYDDYELTELAPASPACIATSPGKLNRFEVRISQSRIEVLGTPYSDDGKQFGAPVTMYAGDLALPYSRGYVHFTTHNHATLKYSQGNSQEAWIARWDNIGFDGPVIGNTREYEVPDSLTPGQDAWNRAGPVVSVGYRIPDAASAPLKLKFAGVDKSKLTGAQLSISVWYLVLDASPSAFVLRQRWNGGAWREHRLNDGELAILNGSQSQGQLGHVLDVAAGDLRDGDNELELATVAVPQNYPPVAANIDLILRHD
jgi:hypothetical protein